MLPLERITIENFRGIRRSTLELSPRVTVLFGSNAGGKTSVLDAMAIALGAMVSRVPNAKGRDYSGQNDLRVPLRGSLFTGVPDPEAEYALITAEGQRVTWDVLKLRSKQSRRPARSGLTALHGWVDPRIKAALDHPGRPTTPIPLVAAYGNERAVVDVPLRERDFNRAFSRLSALDASLKATTRFKAVFEWFRIMEDEERRERERRRDFDYTLPALDWVRRAVEKAELRCHRPRVETQPIRMLVDFEHEDGVREPLDLRQLSDGYRTHLALVVDLARRMVQLNPSDDLSDPERGTNTHSVVLIDEVDLHLDPLWQSRVVHGLLAAFPNTQFVLSTHSEQVIGSVEAEHVRRLVWRAGSIEIEPVPFAQGATGERILIDLMGAWQRVPGPVTDRLRRYLALVSAGEGQSGDAQALRATLDAELPRDPILERADAEMRRQSLMRQFASP